MNTLPELIDEQTCTCAQLIAFADHYRYRQDYLRAEEYYNKALETMTEIESKPMWNVYRKMIRMKNDNNDRYRDYFIEQYSKYNDDNSKHFEIISTLQIIIYKFFLDQNQFDLAFDCLISGTFILLKSIDFKCISNLFDRFVHQDEITNPCQESLRTAYSLVFRSLKNK